MNKIIVMFTATLMFLSCTDSELESADLSNNPGGPPVVQSSNTGVVLYTDTFEGTEIVVAGNANDLFIVSFERMLDGNLMDFSTTDDPLPVIMEDNEGNKWNIFGFAVSGPRLGQRLVPTNSMMGYWFAFATFYPGLQIYPDSGGGVNDGEVIEGSGNWLIPENEVRSGGVGRDGIPAISDPKFEDTFKASFIDSDDMVVGIHNGTSAKAYPHDVLDWHEIVNDELNNLQYSIIYCPLTGTATGWDRNIKGQGTTFGVSGLLYNTNIVPYDRATGSNWSQLFDAAVFGELKGTIPKKYMVLETKWETWEALFSASEVMNFNTSYSRSYGSYPYGDYKVDKSLIFPVKYNDDRVHNKERVHAVIINGNARIYRFNIF